MEVLAIKKLNKNLPTPNYATPGSVGLDVYVSTTKTISPHSWELISLGIIAKPPKGTFIAVLPRSSTFRKTGLLLANSMGVIDPDYCGDKDVIMALVYNTTNHEVTVKEGDRLFQLLVLPILTPEVVEVEGSLQEYSRGGHGSTDTKEEL